MLPARGLDPEAIVAVQAAVIAELRAANAALRSQVVALEAANAEQARGIGVLEGRVAELERRLGQDSANSSRPPSSDGLRKPVRGQRRGSGGRKPGKQPGAPGAHLAQVAEPDEVIVHLPERCAGCGAGLADAVMTASEARQVFDLPKLRLRVVEHRIERRCCACGQVTAGVFPEGVRAPAQCGPGVRALGCYLLVYQHLPVDRAAQLLADVLGAPMATGTLAGVVAEAAGGLAGFVEVVRRRLATAPVAHFDESVRREAPGDRVGVKGLHRWAVAAAWLKLRAA
jgi:transposase